MAANYSNFYEQQPNAADKDGTALGAAAPLNSAGTGSPSQHVKPTQLPGFSTFMNHAGHHHLPPISTIGSAPGAGVPVMQHSMPPPSGVVEAVNRSPQHQSHQQLQQEQSVPQSPHLQSPHLQSPHLQSPQHQQAPQHQQSPQQQQQPPQQQQQSQQQQQQQQPPLPHQYYHQPSPYQWPPIHDPNSPAPAGYPTSSAYMPFTGYYPPSSMPYQAPDATGYMYGNPYGYPQPMAAAPYNGPTTSAAYGSYAHPPPPPPPSSRPMRSKRQYRKKTPPSSCAACGVTDTPEWRKGPSGSRTLCNACGLQAQKLFSRQPTSAEEIQEQLRILGDARRLRQKSASTASARPGSGNTSNEAPDSPVYSAPASQLALPSPSTSAAAYPHYAQPPILAPHASYRPINGGSINESIAREDRDSEAANTLTNLSAPPFPMPAGSTGMGTPPPMRSPAKEPASAPLTSTPASWMTATRPPGSASAFGSPVQQAAAVQRSPVHRGGTASPDRALSPGSKRRFSESGDPPSGMKLTKPFSTATGPLAVEEAS